MKKESSISNTNLPVKPPLNPLILVYEGNKKMRPVLEKMLHILLEIKEILPFLPLSV